MKLTSLNRISSLLIILVLLSPLKAEEEINIWNKSKKTSPGVEKTIDVNTTEKKKVKIPSDILENSPTNLFKNSVSKETLYVLCLWQKYLEFCSQEEELEDIIPWLNETVHQLLASLPSKRRLKKRDITLEIVSLRAVIEILTFVQQKSLASELQNQLLEPSPLF